MISDFAPNPSVAPACFGLVPFLRGLVFANEHQTRVTKNAGILKTFRYRLNTDKIIISTVVPCKNNVVINRYWKEILEYFSDHITLSECEQALGMENGLISDEQISASSEFDEYHAAIQGRLRFQPTSEKAGAWVVGTTDANQWLQVDLDSLSTTVTRVATQRRDENEEWVTNYNLQYGDDEVSFQYYREEGETATKVIHCYRSLTRKSILNNNNNNNDNGNENDNNNSSSSSGSR